MALPETPLRAPRGRRCRGKRIGGGLDVSAHERRLGGAAGEASIGVVPLVALHITSILHLGIHTIATHR